MTKIQLRSARTKITWILGLATVAFTLMVVTACSDSTTQGPAQETMSDEEFGQRVRNYLLQHPEVIAEALQQWQRNQMAEQQAQQADQAEGVIKSRRDELINDPMSPVGGNPDGDVTVVEFFDYNCPHCRRVVSVVAEAERKDPELRLVYKDLPVLGASSVFAARAALASRKQDGYLAFHRALLQEDKRLTEERIMEIAALVGLDTEKLKADMEDPAIRDALARNRELAQAIGITGTPSFVIGDEVVQGAVDLNALEELIAKAREASKE